MQEETLAAAKRNAVRILGPNCLGLIRTDGNVNATFVRTPALAGRLALVSQTGANLRRLNTTAFTLPRRATKAAFRVHVFVPRT